LDWKNIIRKKYGELGKIGARVVINMSDTIIKREKEKYNELLSLIFEKDIKFEEYLIEIGISNETIILLNSSPEMYKKKFFKLDADLPPQT
jgi:hypothetical protein